MQPSRSPPGVTEWLQAWSRGDAEAEGRLYGLIYEELRRQAARLLRRERREHTLQPTALVHEAYLRLTELRPGQWPSRAHFFAMAARVMRHVLVDHARRRRALKREGALTRVPWADDAVGEGPPSLDVIDLEDALQKLAALDPEQARIVELRLVGRVRMERRGLLEDADGLGLGFPQVQAVGPLVVAEVLVDRAQGVQGAAVARAPRSPHRRDGCESKGL